MAVNASRMTAPGKMKRFQVLAGAILVQLILGTVYGYSIFWEPLTSNIFPTVITTEQEVAEIAAAFMVAAVLCLLSAGLAVILQIMHKNKER